MNDFETIWAIQQVYHRYCECIDTKDFSRLHEVFTVDSLHDYTQGHTPGVQYRGLADFIARLERRMGPASNCGATHHSVSNFRIAVSGGVATAKVTFFAVHRGQNKWAGKLYSLWGVYNDDLAHTPQGWRVTTRRFIVSLREGPLITADDPPPARKRTAKKPAKKKTAKAKRRA